MQIDNLENGFRVIFSSGVEGLFFDQSVSEPPPQSVYMKQLHSNIVHEVSQTGDPLEGDALVTNIQGLNLVIRTADCVPLIACGRGVIGICHAGWKGFAKNIFDPFINSLKQYSQTLEFAIGPSICRNHFEVGNDVLAEILNPFASKVQQGVSTSLNQPGKSLLDLRLLLKQYLKLEKGILDIADVRVCTFCDSRFASFRRDKTSQRNLSMVLINPS